MADPALDRALRQLRDLCRGRNYRQATVFVRQDGRCSLFFEREEAQLLARSVLADLHPDSALPAPDAAMRAAFGEWGREEGEDG